jgi:hypothetical protein
MNAPRIVVALQSVPQDRAMLDAAVRVAGLMHAELVALLVEDVNLLHMAGLPFAREIGYPSAAPRGIDVTGMERSLKTRAAEVQRRVAAAAARTPLRWTFRVTRGAMASELRSAAVEADLVLAGLEQRESRVAAICRESAVDAVRAALGRLAVLLHDGLEVVLLDSGAAREGDGERELRRLLAEAGRQVRVSRVSGDEELRDLLRNPVC